MMIRWYDDGVADALVNHETFKLSGPAVFIEYSADHKAASRMYFGPTNWLDYSQEGFLFLR